MPAPGGRCRLGGCGAQDTKQMKYVTGWTGAEEEEIEAKSPSQQSAEKRATGRC